MVENSNENIDDEDFSSRMKNRYDAIISIELDLFNRLDGSIHALNSQNGILLGFSFAIIIFEISIITSFLNNEVNIGGYSIYCLILFLATMVASIFLSLNIFHPTDYKEYDLYQKERYSHLLQANETDLYNDIIYFYKEAYDFNYAKYMDRIKKHRCAFYLFSLSSIFGVITIISIYIGCA